MFTGIERREAKRPCYCRGCGNEIGVGQEIVVTRTYTNRGGQIIFCLDCAKEVGRLANE